MTSLFIDIDTQNDFVLPAGALYAPGAERIIPTIAELNRFAVSKGFGLVSTACLHSEDDPEFEEWPPHCVAGTVGQQKPGSTLAGQFIFEKQTTDVFRHPGWLPYLQQQAAGDYFVYGVVTEVCVRFAAEGLLALGRPVTVVSDAVRSLSDHEGEAFFDWFVGRGGRVTTLAELLAIH